MVKYLSFLLQTIISAYKPYGIKQVLEIHENITAVFQQMLNENAKGCIISDKTKLTDDFDYVFLVPDTKIAYLELAGFYKEKTGVKTVAITGSNGKTTTKELTQIVVVVETTSYYFQHHFSGHTRRAFTARYSHFIFLVVKISTKKYFRLYGAVLTQFRGVLLSVGIKPQIFKLH